MTDRALRRLEREAHSGDSGAVAGVAMWEWFNARWRETIKERDEARAACKRLREERDALRRDARADWRQVEGGARRWRFPEVLDERRAAGHSDVEAQPCPKCSRIPPFGS